MKTENSNTSASETQEELILVLLLEALLGLMRGVLLEALYVDNMSSHYLATLQANMMQLSITQP